MGIKHQVALSATITIEVIAVLWSKDEKSELEAIFTCHFSSQVNIVLSFSLFPVSWYSRVLYRDGRWCSYYRSFPSLPTQLHMPLYFPGLCSAHGMRVLSLKPLTWGFYGSTVTLYGEMQQTVHCHWLDMDFWPGQLPLGNFRTGSLSE